MFFEVLSLTYHSPITIESSIYGVSLGTSQHLSPHSTISATGSFARGRMVRLFASESACLSISNQSWSSAFAAAGRDEPRHAIELLDTPFVAPCDSAREVTLLLLEHGPECRDGLDGAHDRTASAWVVRSGRLDGAVIERVMRKRAFPASIFA